MPKLGLLASAIGCLVLAGTGLGTLPQEFSPLLIPAGGGSDYFEHMTTQEVRFGPSLYSRKRVLRDCYDGMRQVRARSVPLTAETASLYNRKCLALAEEAVASAPTFSFAWLVKARAHAEAGEFADFNAAHRRSQLSGPNEAWLATVRVAVAELNFAELEPETLAAHEADLLVLANTPGGRTDLASRYVSNPAFRERITALIERLPPQLQRQFVARVRRAMQDVRS